MSGQLQPWTLFIDLKVVLWAAIAVMAAAVVGLAAARRRAAKRPQDRD